MANFAEMKALTFDLFGTILDLGGSLTPFIDESLRARDADVSADEFWTQWRYRQRIEQYQDTIVMLGHSGYLETVRRAVHYVLRANGIDATSDTVEEFMRGWQSLSPFPEVLTALAKMQSRYQLVVLSNGDPSFLEYLVTERVAWDFDDVISVTSVGAFKAASGGLPCRGGTVRARSRCVRDGICEFVRHHGCASMWFQRGVCEPL